MSPTNEKQSLTEWREDITAKVNMILQILKGQELDKDDDGLIGKYRKIDLRLFQFERWKDKTVSWGIGVAFGGGSLLGVLITVIVNILKK